MANSTKGEGSLHEQTPSELFRQTAPDPTPKTAPSAAPTIAPSAKTDPSKAHSEDENKGNSPRHHRQFPGAWGAELAAERPQVSQINPMIAKTTQDEDP